MSTLVFGHRNPDTDAICSALAYADLLRRTTRPDAVACCCGPPNKRTEHVLERAGLAAPRMVMDVRPQVEDVCRRQVVTASFGDSFHEAWLRMKEGDLRAIPVIDADRRVVGVLSVLELMDLFFHDGGDPLRARTVTTSLDKIRTVLGGEFQHAIDPLRHDELLVMVGAMSAEGFTERMEKLPNHRLIVVCGDRPTIQLPAIEHGVRAIVLTGGFRLSSGLADLARLRGVSVIVSPFDTVNTTLRLKSSQFVDPVVETSVVTVPAKAPVAEARALAERSAQPVFPVVGDDGRLVGLAFKSDLISPPRPRLVLVDHNELGQAVAGADEAEIVEVLDHHRLGGGLKSTQPIRFINEPVGSTCTLVARQFRAAGIRPEPGIALCMASGIISDTLHLRSPTTTDTDREILGWLAGLCGVDLEAYARDFFEIGSALRSSKPAEVIREDCKEFSEQGVRFSISQIEETGFDLFWERKEELRTALEEFATRQRLDFSALLVTDVVTNGSLLLLSRESDAWEETNYPRLDRGLYSLKGIVSRKKQLLPLVSQLLAAARA
ncbi:manganese-dependent inorganic pyrophosphatase [Planctomycetia bacterium]|nr:manganese-dependent inorganic pyrophosphatase [Planctomycetia bacterium]